MLIPGEVGARSIFGRNAHRGPTLAWLGPIVSLIGAGIGHLPQFSAWLEGPVLRMALQIEGPVVAGVADDEVGRFFAQVAPLVVEATAVADRPHVEDGH